MDKEKILIEIKEILIANKLSISSAESCTGGLLSSYLTDISGSSAFIFQNFVTYSNDAKMKFLNVKKETLEKYGAVSSQTAYEMSEGLLNYAPCSIATTGLLGPNGGSEEKPVGLCYISFGLDYHNKKQIEVIEFFSKKKNRYEIKVDIVEYTLMELVNYLNKNLNNIGDTILWLEQLF